MLETAPSELASQFPRNCSPSQPVSNPWKLPDFSLTPPAAATEPLGLGPTCNLETDLETRALGRSPQNQADESPQRTRHENQRASETSAMAEDATWSIVFWQKFSSSPAGAQCWKLSSEEPASQFPRNWAKIQH